MKRIIPYFILLFFPFLNHAQIGSRAVHDKITGIILKEYNTGNYKGIYKILDKDFKKNINEKEISDFFKFNVFDLYGTIKTLTFIGFKNDQYIYLADCKNGKLDLNIVCDINGKISSMQWLPHLEKLVEPPTLNTGVFKSDNPKANAWDLKVDSVVNVFLKNPVNCGLSIAIYKKKEVQYYNYGDVKRGTNQLPTNKTIYEIGSVSKTFTGILLAQAVIDKKMNLNDPVKKYLGANYKNLNYKSKELELIHLANHSSRIHRLPFDLMKQPDYNPLNPYANYNKDLVMKYISNMTIDTFPGFKSEYSNLGMGLLGILIESVYAKSYEDLIIEKITCPMGMADTRLTLNDDQKVRFAIGYDIEGKETPYWTLGALPGAGGIRSNTYDMMKYTIANLIEENPAFKLSHSSTFNDGNNNIGLAWHLFTTKRGNELIWHNGRTAGFGSFCGFIKSKDIGIVVLGNSGNPVDQVALGLLKLLQ